MATTPAFRTSGIASGIDTTTLIDNLVKLESAPIEATQKQQAAFRSQLTAIGDIVSKLGSLRTATAALKTSGVLAVTPTSSAQGFTATASSSSATGRYSVQVDTLAQAARARSQAFSTATSQVRGGTLDLTIDGTVTSITLDDGMTLTEAADRISRSGAAVSATVLETGTQAYLSITRRDTGFTPGQGAASALQIAETSTGSLGQALSAAITQPALNAQVTVDGLTFERRNNALSDVIPGATLTLSQTTSAPEELVLATNPSDTRVSLQKFVTAYNDVMKLVRSNLAIGELTDRFKTLGGDPALRGLQSSLQALVVTQANPGSAVRTLADVGIKTGSDGMLSIDSTRLEKAIATEPRAVNDLFQLSSTGLSDATTALVDRFTSGSSSILTARTNGIDRSIRTLDDRVANLQLRVDAYKSRLIKQFTAMEKVVGGFKSIGDFLTSNDKKSSST
jgi:flagellar hook-associated protein 2